jgi:hypothetical protein
VELNVTRCGGVRYIHVTQDREYLFTRSFAFIEDELIQYGFVSSEIIGTC